VLMSCQVSATDSQIYSSQLALRHTDDPEPDDLDPEPKFRFNRAIQLFLFLTTTMGFIAAIAIAIAFFHPEWVDTWREQLIPNSPQAGLNRQVERN
jgi:protein phosphatase